MRYRIFILLMLLGYFGDSQCVTYKIGIFKDTLNCTDVKGLKQGKWIVHVDPLRGNPGFEEEGVFINDKKEGLWRKFNLMGDKLAEENFKWGNKSGRCLYFTLAGLEREESWRPPSNPDKAYDTIIVQDPVNADHFEKVVVKTDGQSIKNGPWKYYNPDYGNLIKVENYVLDILQDPGDDPMKKLNKVSDTTTTNRNAGPLLPKIVPAPTFGQKAAKKKSVIQ